MLATVGASRMILRRPGRLATLARGFATGIVFLAVAMVLLLVAALVMLPALYAARYWPWQIALPASMAWVFGCVGAFIAWLDA